MKTSTDHHTENSFEGGSPYFAGWIKETLKTPKNDIDSIIDDLHLQRNNWVQLKISERISILESILEDLHSLTDRWIEAELAAKGLPRGGGGEAEEWVILATAFRLIQKIRQSLFDIERFGRPRPPRSHFLKQDQRVIAKVFPLSLDDRGLFPGVTGEVWMEPGVSIDQVISEQAWAYKDNQLAGKVSLVLGAGNVSMLPVADLLHKLFIELQVVVLKMNPVNAHMGPLLEEGLKVLINNGYLGIVYGGAEEGDYICNHPYVEEIHMTGSDKTYEAIVFGLGEEGKNRKAARNPRNKRFTGELGNVSPVIVVPGPWSSQEVNQQARYISTWLVANAGFGCLTPRVIIQYKNWEYRNDLVDAIASVLDQVPTREAYYPGAAQRQAEFISHYPEAYQLGNTQPNHLPWTFIPDVDPSSTNDICFRHEAFCGLFSETAIEADTIEEYLKKAVEFANETLWGTLCATIIVHPKSMRDPIVGQAVENAIRDLRYGTVSTNMLAYYSAYLMGPPWGAFPGSDMYNIQSGIGKTFNPMMFAHADKSVVRAPFKRLEPTEVFSKNSVELCKRLAKYEAAPSIRNLAAVGFSAIKT